MSAYVCQSSACQWHVFINLYVRRRGIGRNEEALAWHQSLAGGNLLVAAMKTAIVRLA
jgi:hypothetical protein